MARYVIAYVDHQNLDPLNFGVLPTTADTLEAAKQLLASRAEELLDEAIAHNEECGHIYGQYVLRFADDRESAVIVDLDDLNGDLQPIPQHSLQIQVID